MSTNASKTPLRVTVLCGGTSDEREISLLSGKNVIHALVNAGYQVRSLDPADTGWITELENDPGDVVFPMLHGRGGEDGTVQALCELLHVPYVGSGVLASATALDKVRAKQVYVAAGLNTPACAAVRPYHDYDAEDIIRNVGPCLVVKPALEGSSLGMTIVHSATPETLKAAIDEAFRHDNTALIEQYIEGTEVTVPVIGNEKPHALPTIEIVPAEGLEFYNYEAKYAPGQSTHIIPSRLGDQVNEQLSRTAERVHEVLGCRGFSRSDFIVGFDAKQDLQIFLIETNTIPGMTDTSLVPDSARAAGIEMEELVSTLIDLALEEHV
ncbi:MAG: D-alanine--D-alanine ligase [Coriobacteriia bacterium]|nr:D-alanine--D-alanine ligase [Coriobacteriia bacterium]